MDNRPKVGVGVFIRRDNKILLLKRKGAHGAGTWGLVGGHLEFGEEPEECALREVEEETGMEIANLRRFAFTNDVFREEQKHYVTIFVVADHVSGEPEIREPDVIETIEWYSWDELPQPLFIPLQNLISLGHHPFKEIQVYAEI